MSYWLNLLFTGIEYNRFFLICFWRTSQLEAWKCYITWAQKDLFKHPYQPALPPDGSLLSHIVHLLHFSRECEIKQHNTKQTLLTWQLQYFHTHWSRFQPQAQPHPHGFSTYRGSSCIEVQRWEFYGLDHVSSISSSHHSCTLCKLLQFSSKSIFCLLKKLQATQNLQIDSWLDH